MDDLTSWIGRSETVRDQIGATPVNALNATLDHPAMPVERGTPLPPLWHWLYFLPMHRQSEIGAGRPRQTRRFPAPGAAAAAHVGRQPVPVPHAGARGRRGGAHERPSPR